MFFLSDFSKALWKIISAFPFTNYLLKWIAEGITLLNCTVLGKPVERFFQPSMLLQFGFRLISTDLSEVNFYDN